MMRLNELAVCRIQAVDITRWVWVATREFLLPRLDGSTFGHVFFAKSHPFQK